MTGIAAGESTPGNSAVDVRKLTSKVAETGLRVEPNVPEFRQATVTATAVGADLVTADLTFNSGVTATAVPCLGTVVPVVTEGVWVAVLGQGRLLVIGTVRKSLWQPQDVDLTAIAALVSAADQVPYSTGVGTWALTALSAFARTMIDDANAAAVLTTLGINELTGRNWVGNGAFVVNQREFSSTTTNGTYGFDRWRMASSGGTVTYSSQAVTIGAPPVTGYEVQNFARLVVSGQSAAGDLAILRTYLEGVRSLAGETVVISYYARAGSGTPSISCEVAQNFGSGGSPSAIVTANVVKQAITTSWVRYQHTFTMPSVSGKTVGTTADTNNVEINFWISAGSTWNSRTSSLGTQAITLDLWGIQLERGSVATPLEDEPYQVALAKCQRFYYRNKSPAASTTVFGMGYCYGSTVVHAQMQFPVTMRIAPTAVEQTGTASHYAVRNSAAGSVACNGVPAFNTANRQYGTITTSVAAGLTAGHATFFESNATASAYIGWSAEY